MALDLAELVGVRGSALSASLYLRQVYIPVSGDPTPFYVRSHDGRWGTRWTLHTTGSPQTAWAEYCRHVPADVRRADPTGGVGLTAATLAGLGFLELGPPVPARALIGLTYTFRNVLDITAHAAALSLAGFGAADLFADDYGQCPQLAEWATGEGFEAIVAPSAAWRHAGGTVCAVLDAGRGCLREWGVAAASARPTVAVAAATTYKRGERPDWIP